MNKIVHLHIPKTAGTSLRKSVAESGGGLEVLNLNLSSELPEPFENFDFVSGHFSYDYASTWGGNLITVLRNPIDRFISIYFYWRQLYESGQEVSTKTKLANRYSLLEFAKIRDEPQLIEQLHQRFCWQLSSNVTLKERFEQREKNLTRERDLVEAAIENLKNFSLVGFQGEYGFFIDKLNEKFNLKVENKKYNITNSRLMMEELDASELKAILNWVEADLEVYKEARRIFA